MKKAFRIGWNRYYDQAQFEKHLSFIQKNIDVVDEITLFTECSHNAYLTLEDHFENARIIRDRIKRYQSIGVRSVGINVLNTIGHTDEAWDVFPKAPMQHVVGKNGKESKTCLCYSSKEFLDYISKKYALYADTGADFIWTDDDIRTQWHEVSDSCYCRGCIALFNEKTGGSYDREGLVEELEKNKELSLRWDGFRSDLIKHLLVTVKNAVRAVAPGIKIGFMSGPQNARADWMDASDSTKGRPGGGVYGFYTDETPITLFEKGFVVSGELQHYSSKVNDIQYEMENFNYQPLRKSVHACELEATQAIMSACNGILFNVHHFDDREDLMPMIRACADKWDVLCKLNDGCGRMGVYCVDSVTALRLSELGIPTTGINENAAAAFVVGKEWEELSDAQIADILQMNVMTDGKGLDILCRRGFEKECGGRIKKEYSNGMAQRFSDHPLNGDFKGYYRDLYMTYYKESNAYELEHAEGGESLAKLETVTHKPMGSCAYIYQRADGTRFAADGYLMPRQMCSYAKRAQVTRVLDWLSGAKLPVRIDESLRVVPVVTANAEGGMTLMLTNASFDKTGSFVCKVRGEGEFCLIDRDGNLTPVECSCENGVSSISIGNIDAWNYVLLTNRVQDKDE
ncbi:MAG: hypothetical protein E7646_07640 [Ruminococcaceae bacterium]|nr:hypothetical protein [Oscillospiraceae bacterium]